MKNATLRPLLALVLALMLALTGQSMAVARTAPGPAGQMVLCTGTGPVIVNVDEDGQPTGPAHLCPDCTFTALAGIAPHQVLPHPVSTSSRLSVLLYISAAEGRDLPDPSARAPPRAV